MDRKCEVVLENLFESFGRELGWFGKERDRRHLETIFGVIKFCFGVEEMNGVGGVYKLGQGTSWIQY